MRFLKLLGVVVPVVALLVFAGGISKADDQLADLEATVGYPLEAELTIQITTQGGILRHVVGTGNGQYVEYKRTVENTIPWSTVSDSDETLSYYKVFPGEEETPNGMTCCVFWCGARTLTYNSDGTCSDFPSNQCARCTMTCTTGNPSCPRQYPWLEIID